MVKRIQVVFCGLILLSLILSIVPVSAHVTQPETGGSDWWDDAWPYRIVVDASASPGQVIGTSINFTNAFAAMGLNQALLDLRSVRVVPILAGVPQSPIPYAESHSTLLDNADNPQIGWSSSGVYWSVNDGELKADSSRYYEGTGSVKATVNNLPGGYGYPGVELRIASGDSLTDWRDYESFTYDVYPEVNASALDQAPDLYWYKLYNTSGCDSSSITQGGPALALDQWNHASVSLKPFHTCTTPNFSDITRMEFHTRDNDTVSGNSGLWDDGDILTLWMDNLRLVDQDQGTLRWRAVDGATTYHIYFDTLVHEGHDGYVLPDDTIPAAAVTGTQHPIEAGGYYHRVTGTSSPNATIWTAPISEKILRTQTAPATTDTLRIQAAKGEFEPFQLIVNANQTGSMNVSISDFTGASGTIPASNVMAHRVDYVTLTRLSDHNGRLGGIPDPLYPIKLPGALLSFTAGVNQPLWFTVEVPRDAEAGMYQATVTIGENTIPVSLEVWDFTLPAEIHLAGEWGFGWSSYVELYKGTDGGVQPCYWTVVDQFYEQFADWRLTPKGVGWPAGLNYPGGVEYTCPTGPLDPDAWGDWDFDTLAYKYLDGHELDAGGGFPSFMIKGPSSNWPPDSRPSSFCSISRGTDPPGNADYNTSWFSYWSAVSDYLLSEPERGAKGYYHIVNEPQTFSDYDIVAYLAQETKKYAPQVHILVSEQVEPYIYANATYPGAKIDIWLPTITNYEVERSHERQRDYGEDVWWYFLYGDRPPLPNPTIIDRPGVEARMIPWLAWRERVGGLLYYSITSSSWESSPWDVPWLRNANGDGFMLYPPKDGTLANNACDPFSSQLVPSIRWALLSQGMEDYEYLWLLNEGDPELDVTSETDALIDQIVDSRTLFSRVPTDVYAVREEIARRLSGPSASKVVSPGSIISGDEADFVLSFTNGTSDQIVTFSDAVPAGLSIVSAIGSTTPVPDVNGQSVMWQPSLSASEVATLTITVSATTTGWYENTATFSGVEMLSASATLYVGTQQIYLGYVLKAH